MKPRRDGTNAQQPTTDSMPVREQTAGPSYGMPLPGQVPAPPMREVVKGWWTSTQRLVPAAEFERADRENASREHR